MYSGYCDWRCSSPMHWAQSINIYLVVDKRSFALSRLSLTLSWTIGKQSYRLTAHWGNIFHSFECCSFYLSPTQRLVGNDQRKMAPNATGMFVCLCSLLCHLCGSYVIRLMFLPQDCYNTDYMSFVVNLKPITHSLQTGIVTYCC